jgi:GT2 family glycosyltransferase
MDYSVTAVVLTYNRLSMLKECISCLRSQTKKLNSIIVINNGSVDATEEWLNEQNDLTVIHQKNSGSAGGYSRGIKEGVLAGFDYLWLMDDDVLPNLDALEKLLDIKELNIEFSFLSSLVTGKNGNKINVPVIDFELNKTTGYADWASHFENGIIRIKQSTYASLLINSKMVPAAGLPIKEFFIWCDDYEYTLRLSRIKPGFFVGDSIVKHLRAIEKIPALNVETDKKRIPLHYFAIRNVVFVTMKNNSKLKGIYRCLKDACFLIKECFFQDAFFYKSFIILKGTFAGFFFRPKIEYV